MYYTHTRYRLPILVYIDMDFTLVCVMLMLIEGVRSSEYRVSEFSCYGDVCNVGNEFQFCSESFRLCRDCEEIEDDCGTVNQPRECYGYCIERAVRKRLAKEESNETVCHVVSVMMNIDNGKVHAPSRNRTYFDIGSKITYRCNSGYELQGPSELVCLEKGQWSQSAMPHCFNNAWEKYKYATIGLSISVSALIVALIYICIRNKRREGEKLSRNSTQQSMQDEEQPFIGRETEQSRQQFRMGDISLRELSNLNEEKDDRINVRLDQTEGHEANNPRQIPCDQVIVTVIENNFNVTNTPAQSPETKSMSQNKNTDTHSDQQTMKNERRDEKLPTEESGKNHSFEETTEGKTCKGTKPLPARAKEHKKLNESFDVNDTDSPEVVPAEDEETQLSRNETNQGQTLKKVGMQDRTFAKGDIKTVHL